MNEEDVRVPSAVGAAKHAVAAAVDAVVERLAQGGRLVYVGAGTSGRLAAVDASECEATFGVPPGLVVALVAGGPVTAPRSSRRRRTIATEEPPGSSRSRSASTTPSSA